MLIHMLIEHFHVNFRYIIDIKWLKQWKCYVGFESWDSYSAGEESANPGPIDNRPILKGTAHVRLLILPEYSRFLVKKNTYRRSRYKMPPAF